MNICFITGQIVSDPKVINYNGKIGVCLCISIPNTKIVNNYTIYLYTFFNIAQDIFLLYRKKDFILIEGLFYVKSNKVKLANELILQDYIIKKYLEINVNKLQIYIKYIV